MAISRLYDTSLTVSRMAWETDDEDNEFSTRAEQGSISAHIQQMSMDLSESLGLRFGKAFAIWCAPTADVQEGDTLSDGTYTYHVKNKQLFNWGSNAHQELYCEREPYELADES